MLQYGDDWIAPDVKEAFIQSLREQPETNTAAIWTPLYLVLEYYSYHSLNDDSIESFNQYWKFARMMETWIGGIATGAILSLSAIRWNNGSKLTIGETFSEGMTHYGRLLGTRIVFRFVLFAGLLAGILPAVLVDFLSF